MRMEGYSLKEKQHEQGYQDGKAKEVLRGTRDSMRTVERQGGSQTTEALERVLTGWYSVNNRKT